jgi:hypothetical protein
MPRLVLVLRVLGIFAYYALEVASIGIVLPAVAPLYSAADVGRARWAIGAGLVLVTVAAYFRVARPADGLPAQLRAADQRSACSHRADQRRRVSPQRSWGMHHRAGKQRGT